ncbi:MAG: hypothetical protein ACR5KW_02540 [Wolbachia sp.]
MSKNIRAQESGVGVSAAVFIDLEGDKIRAGGELLRVLNESEQKMSLMKKK